MLKEVGASGQVSHGGCEACSQWAADNRAALEAYAGAIEQHGTAAEQLQRFLSEPPEAAAMPIGW